ncbi:MAG: dTMP kinase [Maricaulaceae bacterium]
MSASRGRFITLEGGEGAGKSTQARRLAEWLEAAGRDVVQTREPGGADPAEAVRALLVDGDPDRWSAMGEALLLYAARLEHWRLTIAPALARGAWVVCDRFEDSSFAYQGAGGGLGLDTVRALGHLVMPKTARPDLTLVFDVDPRVGLARAKARDPDPSRFERQGLAYHDTVRQAFLDIANAEPKRCAVIDASRDSEAVWSLVCAAVLDGLGITP